MKEYLDAGKAVAVHGLKGDLKIELWGDDVKILKQSGRVFFSPQGGSGVAVTSVRPLGGMALLSLEGVDTPEKARSFVGKVLYVARADVHLPKGRYFITDLLGCRVVDADSGREYGVITEVSHPGAQDLYTVKDSAGREYLLPGVPAFIRERNLEEGRVLVTPIPGLFGGAEEVDKEEQGL